MAINRGKFIVFEGLDGSGKTTQIKRLSAYYAAHGIDCLVTKEPTDGPIGVLARSALHGSISLTTESLALLFAADRAEHVVRDIRPALEAGVNVLCDRFIYSNMAFQGMEVPMSTIASYNERAMIAPDLTIFIDTHPKECTRRILSARQNLEIYDGEKLAWQIRGRYLELFGLFGDKMPVVTIDGNRQESDVFAQLLDVSGHLLKFFKDSLLPKRVT